MFVSVYRALRVVFCAVMFLGLLPVGHGQQSNGLTYYKVAGPSSVDTGGNVLSGVVNSSTSYQTDGTTVVFLNRPGTNDEREACGVGWGLYTTPIRGGAITPLVTSATQVEASEPSGTAVSVCDNPVLVGGMVYYGAQYTNSDGTTRSGVFRIPLAGGTSTDVVATGDMPPGAAQVGGVDITNALSERNNPAAIGYPNANLYATQFEGTFDGISAGNYILTVPSSGASAATQYYENICDGSQLLLSAPGTIASDGNGVFAEVADWAPPMDGRSVLITANSPTGFGCTFAWDPFTANPDGSNAYRLPGEPATVPAGYSSTNSYVQMHSQLAVSGNMVYVHASRVYAEDPAYDELPYDGIFAVTGGAASTVWSNTTAIPGIDPTIPYCSPSTANPPSVGTVVTAGNYLVFGASQAVTDCATLTSKPTQGGIYIYDQTA